MISAATLATGDYVSIGVYIALTLAATALSMCRTKRSVIQGYFLGGRAMPFYMVGASIFASNIGSEHWIGLPGTAAKFGISVGAFELDAIFCLSLLGWVVLPVLLSSGVSTLPEYMTKRYGGYRLRGYLTFLSLVLYVLVKTSVDLYTAALLLRVVLGWDMYAALLSLLALTAVCTIGGGLAAVIYTDTLQALCMVVGAVTLACIAWDRVGGYWGLIEKYPMAIASDTESAVGDCGQPRDDYWILLRDSWGSDIPMAGFVFGQSLSSIWHWCADQMMVQRTMAARSLSHAQGGCLLASVVKSTLLYVFVMPGMIARVLYPDIIACASEEACEKACGERSGCSDVAFPLLVMRLLPEGVRGLMVAVFLAAIMSSMDSIISSTSTLFTLDVWQPIRRGKASTKELLIVGKVGAGIVVALSVLWMPLIQAINGGVVFYYIQIVTSFFAPPICVLYLASMLIPRYNEAGAFWGLVAGTAVGIVRLIFQFSDPPLPCGVPDSRWLFVRMHYMYMALFEGLVTIIVGLTVSFLTPPPKPESLPAVTFWTRYIQPARDDQRKADEENGDGADDPNRASYTTTMEGVANESETPPDGSQADPPDGQDQPDEHQQPPAPTSEQQEQTEERRHRSRGGVVGVLGAFARWFCGVDDKREVERASEELQRRMERIRRLEQTAWEKRVLSVGLTVVLLGGVAFYVVYSVDSHGTMG
ncbi:unnamed protein product [Vitrella brassicaformis CCMP3155]|uniref:Uncharacterized protein n=2 Tax=Vitrella brassicaformis TaxID=1169539 RepID=A0A0G4FCU8_VITBC|nr:unnamed protein product [Vitrella brassicaformis CCMP3155]|eukprot:CEM10996.1 unnamed protein product [Vitrella brassicaformis CCMP3155]